jgi:hypothetical protein
MKKLHSHFKSLSLALLCITATAQSMEPSAVAQKRFQSSPKASPFAKASEDRSTDMMGLMSRRSETETDNQLAPITFAQTYYHLSQLLLPELMPLIFSLHCDVSGIDCAKISDLIKEKNPDAFVKSIRILLESGSFAFVTAIFEYHFHQMEISICDIKDKYNWTVLHYASLHNASGSGSFEIAKIILHLAGDNAWDLLAIKADYGHTALHVATQRDHIEIVKLLLNTAGDSAWDLLTTKNDNGNTALHRAAARNHIDNVTLLLNAAGKRAQELMGIQNKDGKTAFDLANPQTKKVIERYPKTINKIE